MKRSLKTLLDYAEQQAEHVEDLDQLVVCFAPSSGVRCLLLLDGKREKPCDKMWQSLLMAELAEEATSRIDDGKEPVVCDNSIETDFESDVHTRITVAQLSEGYCENLLKLSPLPCELPCTDQELPDEMRNGNLVKCEQRKLVENGVVKIVMNSINDNAVQTNQPLLTTNYDQHAIESTISHHCDHSSNAVTDVHPSADPNCSSVPNSFDNGTSTKGSETGESDGKKVEVSYYDCAQTVVVTESATNLLHRDANIAIGTNMYSSIPVNSLPQQQQQQQQYRPLQNRAPPASTYMPGILPSSSVQLSYQQFQEKQKNERLDLSMKEKMISTPSSKRVMQSSSSTLASNANAFSKDNSSDSSNSNNYNYSSSSRRSSSNSSSKGNENNTQHITNSSSPQQSSPLAGFDLQNLLEGTMRCTDSSLQADQSQSPSIKGIGTTHMQTCQGVDQRDADFFGSRVDQQDPLRFSEWPFWIWSRTFSYPLPSTAVIAAAGNDGGKVVYWMQKTIRFEDNLALEAAIMLSKRVCLPLIVVYVTDAGTYSDLLNISMAAKERGGRKIEGDGVQGSYGLQGVHLSQQSYMRKSLITYSILESLSRSLESLKVPLVCLTEGSASISKPMHSMNKDKEKEKEKEKGKGKDSDGPHSRCPSTNTSSANKEINLELHPTVSVLVDFFCSLTSSSSVRPSRSDVADGRPVNNQPLAAEEFLEKEKCGVFALFTDDTHHPLSAHITASLVARLPQLPVFCMDSNSMIPPSVAPDHFPGQLDPLAAVLDPLEGGDSKGATTSSSSSSAASSSASASSSSSSAASSSATSSSSSSSSASASASSSLEELMRIFKSHCAVAATQCWDFGSNSVTAASGDNVIGQDSPLHQALFFEEFLFSGVQGGDDQWMDWATVQDLLKSPHSQYVLAACESHTHSENGSVSGRCLKGDGDDVTIAQLMMGTLSPRKAVSSMLSTPWGCEESGAVEQGVKDLSSCHNDAKALIASSNGDASGNDDGSKACDSSRVDAVRHYLVQSDMLSNCCYRALKDGLLPVERVPAHVTAIASPAPRVAPHNAFRKVQEDNMGNGHRFRSNVSSSSGNSSSSNSNSSSSSGSCNGHSKWIIPWFRLLSPTAASALRKANIPKENSGFVYPADIRGASTDDDRFNHIQCVLMLHGVEPRGEKARYWVRFFLTHMGSRIMGLRTAIAELCVHSNTRVEAYGDMVVRLLYQTSIVLRDLG